MINLATFILAIAIVETGDAKHPNGNPAKVGKAGERSEYQITRATWMAYSNTAFTRSNANDRRLSRTVALTCADSLMRRARVLQARDCTVEQLAVAWNAGLGYLYKRGFDVSLCHANVRDYAARVRNTYDRLVKEKK